MDSARQAAQKLLALIPPALPLEVLENYRLRVSIPQAEILSENILMLTRFWIKNALNAGITSEYGKMIWEEIREGLRQNWDDKFGFERITPSQFMESLSTTHAEWNGIMVPGGEPITLFTHVANEIETKGILSSQDNRNVFALFLDFVPVEEIGEVASTIEQGLS